MYRIAFVAPYPQLREVVSSLAGSLEGITLDIREGNYNAGAMQGQLAEQEGAEVIVSVGETAQAIKKKVGIPVVELRDNGYDIIRALSEARRLACEVAVILASGDLCETKLIEELLGIRLFVFASGLDGGESVRSILQVIARQGIRVVVGGAYATYEAQKLGLSGVLLRHGEETVKDALEEAKLVAEIRRRQLVETGQLEAVLDSAHEGIMAVDELGRITALNRRGMELLRLHKEKALGKHVLDVVPSLGLHETIKTGKIELGVSGKFREELITVNKLPIIIDGRVRGAVATLQASAGPVSEDRRCQRAPVNHSLVARYSLDNILGVSRPLQEAKRKAQRYAQADSTVLITGATGTGKELFAQAIHNASPRHAGPFVAVNCTALPDTLLESELFGYEEGAFTGARKGGKQGLFEQAQGGTLFLDEIGMMSPRLQTCLLRVLQEREIRPVGSARVVPVDVRIIAASNTNLEEEIGRGNFRSDLYYRISILRLDIPTLAERREDIPVLAAFFAKSLGEREGKQVTLDGDVLAALQAYEWPGNVRELRNLVERLVLLATGPRITLRHLREATEGMDLNLGTQGTRVVIPFKGNLADMEREIIVRELDLCGGNKSLVARRLGISRVTLMKKLKRYGVPE